MASKTKASSGSTQETRSVHGLSSLLIQQVSKFTVIRDNNVSRALLLHRKQTKQNLQVRKKDTSVPLSLVQKRKIPSAIAACPWIRQSDQHLLNSYYTEDDCPGRYGAQRQKQKKWSPSWTSCVSRELEWRSRDDLQTLMR